MLRYGLFALYLTFSLLIACPPSFAGSNTLTSINAKITSLKQQLHKDTSNRNQLQKKLKALDEKTADISISIQRTQKKSQQKKSRIRQLQKHQAQYQNTLRTQRKQLAQELSAAYMASRQPYLKLLLTQHNPQELSRLSQYYSYIHKYQQERIDALEKTIHDIQVNKQQLHSEQQQLQQLADQKQQQKSTLSKTSQKRKTLIHTINKKIKQHNQTLGVLTQDKQQLDQTIQRLNTPSALNSGQPFTQQKGSLLWPTRGSITHHFGTKIQQSELTWAGVVVHAPMGQPVTAIASGDVIFAKWLSGYGLLVIINHGDGYMSLYGRNQAIYTNKGDHVTVGQQIATVGQTGGFDSPSLYFAIRHNAKPLNPSQWCHTQPSFSKQGTYS